MVTKTTCKSWDDPPSTSTKSGSSIARLLVVEASSLLLVDLVARFEGCDWMIDLPLKHEDIFRGERQQLSISG